jgi:methanol corrinoid protein
MLDVSRINYDEVFQRYDIHVESKEKPEDIAAKMVPTDPLLKKVAEDVVFYKTKDVESSVKAAMGKFKPEEVIEKGLVKGMDIVGELYGRGIYFLPHVMVAAQSMDKGIKVAETKMTKAREAKGIVVMHVAEGDPHDIGKNIAAVLLRSSGFNIVDLGRDVPIEDVVASVEENAPIMVTGTALMTTTMSAFPRITERLEEKGIELPFIGAGGAVNRAYVESFPMGVYAEKAAQGPRLADKAVEGWDYKKFRTKWDDLMTGKT